MPRMLIIFIDIEHYSADELIKKKSGEIRVAVNEKWLHNQEDFSYSRKVKNKNKKNSNIK